MKLVNRQRFFFHETGPLEQYLTLTVQTVFSKYVAHATCTTHYFSNVGKYLDLYLFEIFCEIIKYYLLFWSPNWVLDKLRTYLWFMVFKTICNIKFEITGSLLHA